MALNRHDCACFACDGFATVSQDEAILSGAGDRFLILSYHGASLRCEACTQCYPGITDVFVRTGSIIVTEGKVFFSLFGIEAFTA